MRRLAPALVFLGFVALNAIDWCHNPGWCQWYGLPFRFYGWSDDILTFNGVRIGAPGFSLPAFVADCLVAVLVALAVRRRLQRAQGEPTNAA